MITKKALHLLRDNFVNGALKQWEFEDKPDIKVTALAFPRRQGNHTFALLLLLS
jgi:hypothetical protein